MTLAALLVAALLVAALLSQDGAPGPSIERSDAALMLRLGDGLGLGDGSVIDYGLGPAGVRAVELGGARVLAGELRIDGAVPESAEVLDVRVEADVVVVELALRSKSATLRATDTFRAIRLAGGLGLERRLRAQRRGVQSDTTQVLELVPAPDAPEPGFELPRPDRTVECYGVSTVSEPGITTTLTRAMRPGGVTLWSYRAGLHFMNRALNPGLDVGWTEVVLPLPSAPDEAGDERVGARLVQALVEDPYDRRDLVRDWPRCSRRVRGSCCGAGITASIERHTRCSSARPRLARSRRS